VSAQNYQVTSLATGLDKPWSIAAIDNGAFLITEKSGRLVRLDADGAITAIGGTPEVYYANQGGLLEVLPDPCIRDQPNDLSELCRRRQIRQSHHRGESHIGWRCTHK
jgi:glucose/arabinose dehydrogenase